MPARRIVRDVNEAARDVARALAKTEAFAQSRRDRKKVEMAVRAPQAHSAAWLRRLRLRGPSGDSPSLWLVPRRSRPSTVLRERRVQFVASGFPIV